MEREQFDKLLSGEIGSREYADGLRDWGLTPARVRNRALAVEAERDRLREALARIADLKPRPALDPYDCEERARLIARSALSPESNPEGQ